MKTYTTKERLIMKIETLTKIIYDLERKQKKFFGLFKSKDREWLIESFRKDLKKLWERIELTERKEPAK